VDTIFVEGLLRAAGFCLGRGSPVGRGRNGWLFISVTVKKKNKTKYRGFFCTSREKGHREAGVRTFLKGDRGRSEEEGLAKWTALFGGRGGFSKENRGKGRRKGADSSLRTDLHGPGKIVGESRGDAALCMGVIGHEGCRTGTESGVATAGRDFV